MKFQKLLSASLALLLLVSLLSAALLAVPARAETPPPDFSPATPENVSTGEIFAREECVYARLTPSGGLEEIYMVNRLYVSLPGVIADYGTYTVAQNLTDLSEITLSDDGVTFTAPAGDFYYQGTLRDTSLPWDIEIIYTLDGNTVTPDELAGGAGNLALTVKTSPKADNEFAEHYLLQISLTLDTGRCQNLAAATAAVASVGTSKQLTFTVLPGTSSENTVTADVTDFEMAGIEIAAVPFTLSALLPEIPNLSDTSAPLLLATAQLSDGANSLKDGVASLADGASSLKNGASNFKTALTSVAEQSAALNDGAAQIKRMLDVFAELLPTAEVTRLRDLFGSFQEGLLAYTGAVDELNAAFSSVFGGVQSVSGGLSGIRTAAAQLSDGASTLNQETQSIPVQLQDALQMQFGGLTNASKFEPHSFVSDKNARTTAVQFVFKTGKIVKPAPPPLETSITPEPSFWERLLDLFR